MDALVGVYLGREIRVKSIIGFKDEVVMEGSIGLEISMVLLLVEPLVPIRKVLYLSL